MVLFTKRSKVVKSYAAELNQPLQLTKCAEEQINVKGSGYSAGPSQIVPRGYSTGPGQIVPRLFNRTRLNSYNALICYLTGPKNFMLSCCSVLNSIPV